MDFLTSPRGIRFRVPNYEQAPTPRSDSPLISPKTRTKGINFSTPNYEQAPSLRTNSPLISPKTKTVQVQFMAEWEDDEIVNADMSTQPISLAFQLQAIKEKDGEVNYCSTKPVNPPREDLNVKVEEKAEVSPVAEVSTSGVKAKGKGKAKKKKAGRPRTRTLKPEAPPTRVSKRKLGLDPSNEGLPMGGPSSKRRKYAVPADPIDARKPAERIISGHASGVAGKPKRKQGLDTSNEDLSMAAPSSKRRKYAVPAKSLDAGNPVARIARIRSSW